MKKQRNEGLTPLSDDLFDRMKLPAPRLGPSAIQQRLLDGAARDAERPNEPKTLLFQHSVLCQTCLPYRDPGDEVRTWERSNGFVHLQIRAGSALHPSGERFVEFGLPFGPKARLILMHINQRALAQESPEIDVGDSLTYFVRRVLALDPNGHSMRVVKDQLARLAASTTNFGMAENGQSVTTKTEIIKSFDLWFPKDEHQRVLWPSIIHLSPDYWQSLKEHAVPLDEDHIARLSHSSLALDIYAWLANRLHRVPTNRPITLSWTVLHTQFGQGYKRIDHFRTAFRVALHEVLALYRTARIDLHEKRLYKPFRVTLDDGRTAIRELPAKGLTLYNSPPPITARLKS